MEWFNGDTYRTLLELSLFSELNQRFGNFLRFKGSCDLYKQTVGNDYRGKPQGHTTTGDHKSSDYTFPTPDAKDSAVRF